jgi:hypothetical protein
LCNTLDIIYKKAKVLKITVLQIPEIEIFCPQNVEGSKATGLSIEAT